MHTRHNTRQFTCDEGVDVFLGAREDRRFELSQSQLGNLLQVHLLPERLSKSTQQKQHGHCADLHKHKQQRRHGYDVAEAAKETPANKNIDNTPARGKEERAAQAVDDNYVSLRFPPPPKKSKIVGQKLTSLSIKETTVPRTTTQALASSRQAQDSISRRRERIRRRKTQANTQIA